MPQSSTVLVLDIGNGSVGVALARVTKGHKPLVLVSQRELIVFPEKPDATNLSRVVIQKLDATIGAVLKTSRGLQVSVVVDSVFCTLSSPWFLSQGKVIHITQQKKFAITDRFIQDILEKESMVFVGGDTAVQTIEHTIVATRVDGQTSDNPVGVMTGDFEISLYMSKAEKKFVQSLYHTIYTHCHVDEHAVVFHTFPLIAFSVIRDVFAHVSEYIHVDVAGEITDVTWVKDDMIRQTWSFPVGKNSIFRHIRDTLYVSTDVARSMFRACMDKQLDTSTEQSVIMALHQAEKEWNRSFVQAVQSMGAELPTQIYMTAYPQTAEVFTHFFVGYTGDVLTDWRKRVQVTHLDTATLARACDTHIPDQSDIFLNMESYVASKVF